MFNNDNTQLQHFVQCPRHIDHILRHILQQEISNMKHTTNCRLWQGQQWGLKKHLNTRVDW